MFSVGQKVKFKDHYRNEIITGVIIGVVEVIEHRNKEFIGKKVCSVSQGEEYMPYDIFMEDLKLAE